MKEFWEQLKGFEKKYKINNFGKVISIDYNNQVGIEKELKVHFRDGYVRITLSLGNNKHKSFSLHRIIATQFIPNPENKPFVNHINGIRWDNRIENLEWCTASENMFHKTKVLGKTVKKVYAYNLKGEFVSEFYSAGEGARLCEGQDSKILFCCHGKRKTHKGYMWSFIKVDRMPISNRKGSTKIKVYDINYNLINEFQSITQAGESLGICKSVITRKLKTGSVYKNSLFFKKY